MKYSFVLQGNIGGGWYVLEESWKITKELRTLSDIYHKAPQDKIFLKVQHHLGTARGT